ncbi:Hsp33 family molecular chaperone HslO [Defluviitalea phaphyphila]|uniref:Hsp33 family molecular chaperone HslO n=1 Tax=Defluviitalea phaphyphila TaxID=1473580 RepID=UPI00072FB254|nr:Hsp33 family molecular chaperone HslO [Defluviitalea phaphyphila]
MEDYIVRITDKKKQVRAFGAITTNLVEEARKIHKTTPVVSAALGRLMTASGMMGQMLKGENDIITLQIKGNGPLKGMIVTADIKGNIKGYPYNPIVDIPLNSKGKLDVKGAIGEGKLIVIKDLGLKEPYIGQTNLISGEIAEDITYYFANSEQIPSAVALGVLVDRDYSIKQAGGFIIQILPEAEEETISKLEENLKNITSITHLLEEGKKPEDILKFLLEDIIILDKVPVHFNCNCSRERVEKALISIGLKDLKKILEEDKKAELKCHFCNKKYMFDEVDLKKIINRLSGTM